MTIRLSEEKVVPETGILDRKFPRLALLEYEDGHLRRILSPNGKEVLWTREISKASPSVPPKPTQDVRPILRTLPCKRCGQEIPIREGDSAAVIMATHSADDCPKRHAPVSEWAHPERGPRTLTVREMDSKNPHPTDAEVLELIQRLEKMGVPTISVGELLDEQKAEIIKAIGEVLDARIAKGADIITTVRGIIEASTKDYQARLTVLEDSIIAGIVDYQAATWRDKALDKLPPFNANWATPGQVAWFEAFTKIVALLDSFNG